MIERQSTKLRQLLRAKTFLHMPSVYNVIGARLVQSLGFEAVYIGGYVTGGSTAITEPLLTMNEQIEPARNIAQNVNIPLLADAGSGWGEPIHTMRTMREFIRALGHSKEYQQQFFGRFVNSRVVELAFRHFLGRGIGQRGGLALELPELLQVLVTVQQPDPVLERQHLALERPAQQRLLAEGFPSHVHAHAHE